MKKTLAIVLALVMVLAMIPAMSAHTTEYKTITDKSYYLSVNAIGDDGEHAQTYPNTANSITYKYDWNTVDADEVDRYADKVAKVVVSVEGWDDAFKGLNETVTIDGKVLAAGMATADKVDFEVELTKAGYTDTFVITVSEEVDGVLVTETAKISIVLKNTGLDYKTKTAKITNIASLTDKVSAYIVGDKIYLDYVAKTAHAAQVAITFADENGAAFTGHVYAMQPYNAGTKAAATEIAVIDDGDTEPGYKLVKSAAKYNVSGYEETKVEFVLDPAVDTTYKTKQYAIKVRTDIKEEDPKGIYFAETTKAIAMGEKYTPVVVGVKTGKPVAAKLALGDKTDAEVIDLIGNDTVIGTREGVAYITASYKTDNGNEYKSSSMKIIVTLPGESIPDVEPSATVYYVTCRALNVRAGAGTSYKKVDLIHRGDAVKVVELKNGWAKLADGTYVCAKYIAK